MCGITGMINLKQGINKSLFVKMNNIIKYRGPDDEGYSLMNLNHIIEASGNDSHKNIKKKYANITKISSDNTIIFGHRRLSILDLTENAHQPMCDFSHDIVITYNGEIYNYIEIRDDLIKKGYKFTTNSDTEVIINAYKEYGEECVNHFNGMWSFAIFDRKKSIIFCSRDRFGVKPFYYYYDNDRFIFCSEVKQILEDPTIDRIANDEVIYNYLVYGICDYNDNTFFKNIYALPASSNMIINIDFKNKKFDVKVKKYYNIACNANKDNEKEIIKSFSDEFRNSVKLRLRSDVEIGSCLSGGLDSSSIVTIACDLLNDKKERENFQTFTACYDENKDIDERYYSKKVVKKCKCKENLVFPNRNSFENSLKKIIWHQDFPFVSTSIYSQWNVMMGANKKKIKVLLDGQGADETLFGYERYAVFLIKYYLKKLKLISLVKDYMLLKKNAGINLKKLIVYAIYFSNKNFIKKMLFYKKKTFYNKEFLENNNSNDDYIGNLKFDNPFNLNISDIFYSNLGQLLRYEDRNSMAFSIESRVPFLDYNLVQFVLNVPINYRINGGWLKSILRKSMVNKLDKDVVYRKNKIGFASPQNDLLNKLNDDFIGKYLNNMKSKKYFNEEKIKQLFLNKGNDSIRWYFLCLEIWLDTFNVKVDNNS